MHELIEFLIRHGYLVLFGFVFAEQIGLPVPSTPILLALGALAADGRLSFTLALLIGIVASLLSDIVWYQLGHHRGHAVLGWICRISLEPDSCIRRTEDFFARHGSGALVIAKFVPGLNTAAPPLAGMLGMHFARFLILDTLGAILWISVFSGIGYLFSSQLEAAALWIMRFGFWALVLAVAALALLLIWKYLLRRRFIRDLRIARLTPEDLMAKLEQGENVFVADLRHSLELEGGEHKLPGAVHLPPEELERRHQEIPRDRDVVLYCT